MEAVYYDITRNAGRHKGNVIDLAAYRRRQGQVEGNLALAEPPAAPCPRTERPRTHPRRRRRGLADWLDMAASVTTIAVVAGAWVHLML